MNENIQNQSLKKIDTLKLLSDRFAGESDEVRQRLANYEKDLTFKLIVEADVYFNLEAFNEAKFRYELYLKIYPSATHANYQLGTTFVFLDDLTKAAHFYLLAHETEPSVTKYLVALVELHYENEQIELAEKYLTNYLKNYRDNKDAVLSAVFAGVLPYSFFKRCWKLSFQISPIKVVKN